MDKIKIVYTVGEPIPGVGITYKCGTFYSLNFVA